MASPVDEVRSAERFVTSEPLSGIYGSASIVLLNMSAQGAQIAHAQPLRLGTRARLWFRRGDVAVNVQALTVWSHLSRNAADNGKLLYHSGVRVEEGAPEFEAALKDLLEKWLLRPDPESLQRKRQKLAERTQKNATASARMIQTFRGVDSDQALLIQQARERLLSSPDEAKVWYQRAKFALTNSPNGAMLESMRHREDVLAVWEYLERTVEISTIVTVLERMRGVNDRTQ